MYIEVCIIRSLSYESKCDYAAFRQVQCRTFIKNTGNSDIILYNITKYEKAIILLDLCLYALYNEENKRKEVLNILYLLCAFSFLSIFSTLPC